jgi:Zn-finger nucleic acid-binding protein
MNCPLCLAPTLIPHTVEPDLPAQHCTRCGGLFLASTAYWAWLERHGPLLPERPAPEQPVNTAEPASAKRCPACGYLLLRYAIGHALAFGLDQCGHCNSFWLDRDEWALLRERNLHDKLHKITTAPWQRQLRQEASRAALAAIYTEAFGATDYAELRRVRAWLDSHPQRQRMRAYLIDRDPYAP